MQTKNKELEKKLDESNDLLRLVLAKLEGEPPLKKSKLSDNTTDDQVSEAPAEDQCKAVIPEVSVPDWDLEVETSLTNTGNLSYFLYYWYNNDAEESYANYIAQEYAGVKVNQTLKTRMSKLRRIKNFLVANLPVCDEDPLTNQTILAKPLDVSDYNVWKKNLKALSTSAFKNSQVRLGVDYSEKDIQTLKWSKYLSKIQSYEKK